MERMHLKDGGSIGIATIDAEGGSVTRFNLVDASGNPATVKLTPEEEEDLVYLVETGSVRPRCRGCGCVQERACIRVEGEDVVETCGWAELEPKLLCTACIDGAKPGWKHPDEQEAFWPVEAAAGEPA